MAPNPVSSAALAHDVYRGDSGVRAISPEKEKQAQDALQFSAAALALAGHEVTDPYVKDILVRQAYDEITGDEARGLIRKHILGH